MRKPKHRSHVMHEIQPKLARLSTRGRQTILEKSGHGIPQEAPETVVDAVTEVVDTIRHDTHVAPLPTARPIGNNH